jgi:hypothetical protein
LAGGARNERPGGRIVLDRVVVERRAADLNVNLRP